MMTAVLTTTATPAAVNSTQNTLFDWLKPRRGVAITRLKNNGFAMVVALLIAQLAPLVPSPTTCLWMAFTGGKGMARTMRWLCWIELALYAVLSANIVQSYIGLRYPPPPCEPLNSPAKRAQVYSPPASRPLKGFTPSHSQMNTSFASSYAPSPVSTPSRVVNYKSPLSNSSSSSSPFQTSLNSSLSTSLLSSPLGYRARQPHSQSVRSLRGSLLNQFEADGDDEF